MELTILFNKVKPKDYYVYVHRRLTDGEVFYVGKGFGPRYKSTHSRNPHWVNTAHKHGVYVEIVQDGLQEWYAYELESNLVDYYGRKTTGHGNLVNAADGGGEIINRVSTQEFRELISELKCDQNSYVFRNIITNEVFEGRRKDFRKCHPYVDVSSIFSKKHAAKGWTVDGVQRNIRQSRSKGAYDVSSSVYVFKHISGECFTGTREEFRLKYGKNVNRLFMTNPRRSISGWSLISE